MLATSIIKAVDTALVVTAIVILCQYVPTLWYLMRKKPLPNSVFLMTGIIVTWIGALVIYSEISIKLWFDTDAAAVGMASIAARMFYLILFLTGGAIHIAAAQRERYGIPLAFFGWSSAMAVLMLTIILIDSWRGLH
jgi:hypothetical protein